MFVDTFVSGNSPVMCSRYIYIYFFAMKSRTNRWQIAQKDKHEIQEYLAKYMFALWSNSLFMISSQLFFVLYWYKSYEKFVRYYIIRRKLLHYQARGVYYIIRQEECITLTGAKYYIVG